MQRERICVIIRMINIQFGDIKSSGLGDSIMTPEGFLFAFLAVVVGICITVVIVVASTIASTVAAVADEEDEEE